MIRRFFFSLLLLCFLSGCSTSSEISPEIIDAQSEEAIENNEEENEDENTADTTESTENDSDPPIRTTLRTYIFGHSLLVHDPPAIPTPSNETTVPHWMAELSTAVNFDFSVSGQYGFLPQHANLPPIAQWGFDRAAGAWDSDTESFSDANFNTILLTAGNFIQYQSASSPYEGDNPNNTTPIAATLEIFDWVEQQEPNTAMYIYENWPDMAQFLGNGVPASASEFQEYNAYTTGGFHDWWLAYYTEVQNQRPDLNVKMIPVGPIISKLLTDTELATIPFSALYEDDAPHGRPTIYFLASLITYMSMYGTKTPANFQIPSTIHEMVRNNYSSTVDFIWNELNSYEDSDGNSLVFS